MRSPLLQYQRLSSLQESLDSHFFSYGYQGMNLPLLQQLDIYLNLAGEQIRSKLYHLEATDNSSVYLRPEMTTGVLRWFLSQKPLPSLPARYSYFGPVFRKGETPSLEEEMFQAGVELLGAPGPPGDAEILAMAVKGLEELGVANFRLYLGHHSLVEDFLEAASLSPLWHNRLRSWVLQLPGALEHLPLESPSEAQERGSRWERLFEPLQKLSPEERHTVIRELAARLSQGPGPAGEKAFDAVATGLLHQIEREGQRTRLPSLVEQIRQLHALQGPPGKALKAVRKFLEQHGLSSQPADELEQTVELLKAYGVLSKRVVIAPTLLRRLSYYNGILFDLRAGEDDSITLGGGGRYDRMVALLGGPEGLGACGFAYRVEHILSLTPHDEEFYSPMLFVPEKGISLEDTIVAVEALRNMNLSVKLVFPDQMPPLTEDTEVLFLQKSSNGKPSLRFESYQIGEADKFIRRDLSGWEDLIFRAWEKRGKA